jgi:flagellum-specific peptidoglycan hydrolase FlgJ
MANMRNYGIPASIILAQGILESGAGRGDLAKCKQSL